MATVPRSRIQSSGKEPGAGRHVLYWMIAARRTRYNFALDRAVELSREHGCPLLVLEALRCDYPWASDRLHAFVIAGMRDNAAAFAKAGVTYYPYVEQHIGAGRGLLAALADRAVAVVTDDFPCFFLPRMISAAERKIEVAFERIDSNGIYPMRSSDRVFTTAASFRRHLQKNLAPHLAQFPRQNPLASYRGGRARVGAEVRAAWPAARVRDELGLAALPIDHSVAPIAHAGGASAADRALTRFIRSGLSRYHSDRNQPSARAESGLSPYLHFGHISSHEIFLRITRQEEWSPERLALKATGSREGWWGASEQTEAFLDQLITWRELGYNRCALDVHYDRYDSLPPWALQTLADHVGDERPWIYGREQLEAADTHDPVWNASQRQLVREGVIHNYLRMLWGKKILEWSRDPAEALETMIELNNKYALDGRNPNSYSGIFWVLGRYDRAWGPERPIFGKVRYMSSDSALRKLRLAEYLEHFGN